MNITPELIEKIQKRCLAVSNPSTAKHISEELTLLQSIETRRTQLYHKRELAKKDYEKELEKIKAEEKLLQEKCPHYHWKHFPDAAGGNDSYNRCELCGKED